MLLMAGLDWCSGRHQKGVLIVVDLGLQYGYPIAIGAMLVLCGYIVWRFKKSGWL